MTILITGGAGYIGSHIAHALVDAGERIIVVDDLSTGFSQALPANAQLFVGNCGDPDLVAAVLRQHSVTAIMHLAGSVSVSESVSDPMRYQQNNVLNTRALIKTAIKFGITQFIFSSSAAVYGQSLQMLVTEDTPTHPLSPYGQSKLDGEQMLQDAAAMNGMKFVTFRYFNVAGADPRLRTGQSTRVPTHLIKRAVQTAIGLHPEMEMYGADYATPDGTCIRDYIHVADVVQAHIDAIHYLRAGGEPVTLNCGSERGASVREVIEAVKRISGVDFLIVSAPRRVGDPPMLVASAARARAVLGWRPQVENLDEIIRHTLAWEVKLRELEKIAHRDARSLRDNARVQQR